MTFALHLLAKSERLISLHLYTTLILPRKSVTTTPWYQPVISTNASEGAIQSARLPGRSAIDKRVTFGYPTRNARRNRSPEVSIDPGIRPSCGRKSIGEFFESISNTPSSTAAEQMTSM